MGEKKGYNRRDFLKIVGAGSGLAAAGCGKELPEKLIPYVVQPDDVVPGVATWYSGTCNECSAGCGTLVRTREGRAVKVEGNPEHPLNQGGLCALGQSSLQALYDPDRVREPLKRGVNGAFEPISWADAISILKDAIADRADGEELVLLTDTQSGSSPKLIESFISNIGNASQIEYDPTGGDVFDLAAEQSFGAGKRLELDFSKADVIVGFGADYLGSWHSPVAYAKQWSKTRKPKKDGSISWVAHLEPRLSVTAGNADLWLKNSVGSEESLLLLLLKEIVERGRARGLNSSEQQKVRTLASSLDADEVLSNAGIKSDSFYKIVKRLVAAKSSLVVADYHGKDGVAVCKLVNLLNAALGNIGQTVRVVSVSKTLDGKTSYQRVAELVDGLLSEKRKVGVLMISGVNPAYSLSKAARFANAAAKAKLVVSLSIQLDETASLAQLVLPVSTLLESWSDSEPLSGVLSLNQPSMQPLYKTQALEDTLIQVSAALDKPVTDAENFHEYLKSSWKSVLGSANFESQWAEAVQQGGWWKDYSPSSAAFSLSSAAFRVSPSKLESKKAMTLLAFPTIKGADGSAANRPWIQELPEPITTAVWGSWAEVHSSKARELGVSTGDVVQVVSSIGGAEFPVLVTDHLHPDVVAVPLGSGHTGYGRYATGVGANAFTMLPFSKDSSGQQWFAESVKIRKTISKEKLVTTQGHDSQEDRGIIRSIKSSKLKKDAGHGHHHGEHGHKGDHAHGDDHGGGHHDPFALGPQPDPKQMYVQMDHPLYEWGMSIDLNSCTGCSACVVACYAENNVPVVGKDLCEQGREMSWLRIERYFDGPEEQPVSGFLPMMCQHCNNAPCEPVCPVYATYHNEEGLNAMVYNRCVGTRYCANNCSYKVRRFNWFHYETPEPLTWQLNPDVTVREVGVMEKCTFCVQRIRGAQNDAKNEGREVQDGEVSPACASSCPTNAIKFGNLKDKASKVYKESQNERAYKVLDSFINTQPAISYLAKVEND